MSRPNVHGRGLELYFLLTTFLRFPLIGDTQCEIFPHHTMTDVVNESRSYQLYPDDDGSDDHIFEEGHQVATVSPESGDSRRVCNALAG